MAEVKVSERSKNFRPDKQLFQVACSGYWTNDLWNTKPAFCPLFFGELTVISEHWVWYFFGMHLIKAEVSELLTPINLIDFVTLQVKTNPPLTLSQLPTLVSFFTSKKMGMKDSKENKVGFGTFLKFNSTSPVFLQNMNSLITFSEINPQKTPFSNGNYCLNDK